jgi:hypothetical protein
MYMSFLVFATTYTCQQGGVNFAWNVGLGTWLPAYADGATIRRQGCWDNPQQPVPERCIAALQITWVCTAA